jgi:hypothetical protein
VNANVEPRLTRLSRSAAAGMLLWISRTVLALLASYPVLLAVRASSMTAGPEGDAVLFQPGSLMLLELLRVGGPWLSSAATFALVLLGLSAILELIPLAVALDLLATPDRPLLQRAARGFRLFPRFLALGVIALLAQSALLLAASLLGAAFKPMLASADERLRSIAPIALMGLGLLACGWFGGALDIARAPPASTSCRINVARGAGASRRLPEAAPATRVVRCVSEYGRQRARGARCHLVLGVLRSSACFGTNAGTRLRGPSIGDRIRARLARALARCGARAERRKRLNQAGCTFRYS